MPKSLSRKKDSRRSLLRNLATSLILYEKITTTEAKAKEVKSIVDHLLNIAQKNTIASRRQCLAYLFDKNATKKIFEVLNSRYKNEKSGFILSYRIGSRLGDSAPQMILKLKQIEVKQEPVTNKSSEKDKDASKESITKTQSSKAVTGKKATAPRAKTSAKKASPKA